MKYKVVREEYASSDETLLEADDLDELSRLLNEKTGPTGLDIGMNGDEGVDLGLDGDGGLL